MGTETGPRTFMAISPKSSSGAAQSRISRLILRKSTGILTSVAPPSVSRFKPRIAS